MINFALHRSEDVSGISGTGRVAEGVLFGNGKVVLGWATTSSVEVFDSIEDVIKIHGHEGRTKVIWL
jgi:hypothetical protein